MKAIRSHQQVAALMAKRGYPMSWQRVYEIEKRALAKLAYDRELKEIADELGVLLLPKQPKQKPRRKPAKPTNSAFQELLR